ncbi:hypothetical protein A9G24_10050 [Gilliamella sp. App6-5]|uniref:hypothetical protein n=1 Tax=Gilliamella sp. App6-5 TaxID=3120232 RepID=UPI00080E7323|nr:hypothetical protein [Gilliamella apicola]OCG11002.1 hypothetical protein A9G24_10050 [Gilliamella apicola]
MDWISKMDWTLICDILSTISALGVLVCTIIGFKFIGKQTNIAKNKDMLILIQKDFNLCFEDFERKYDIFFEEFEKLIKNSCLNDKQFESYNKNINNNKMAQDYENKITEIKNSLEQFNYELPSEKLTRMIEPYQWWFDFIQCKPQKFHVKKNAKYLIKKFIKNININDLQEIHDKIAIENDLLSKLEEIKKQHNSDIDSLKKQTSNILSDIAKKAL